MQVVWVFNDEPKERVQGIQRKPADMTRLDWEETNHQSTETRGSVTESFGYRYRRKKNGVEGR